MAYLISSDVLFDQYGKALRAVFGDDLRYNVRTGRLEFRGVPISLTDRFIRSLYRELVYGHGYKFAGRSKRKFKEAILAVCYSHKYDPYLALIREYLKNKRMVCRLEIAIDCLGYSKNQVTRSLLREITRILQYLGWYESKRIVLPRWGQQRVFIRSINRPVITKQYFREQLNGELLEYEERIIDIILRHSITEEEAGDLINAFRLQRMETGKSTQ